MKTKKKRKKIDSRTVNKIKRALLGASVLQHLTFLILSLMIVDRFWTLKFFVFLVTTNFRICTWKDEMSMHEFIMMWNKVLRACKMHIYVNSLGLGGKLLLTRIYGKRISWDTGTSFTACCLEVLYRLMLQNCNFYLKHLTYLAFC